MATYLIGSGIAALPAGLSDKDAALVGPLYRAINNLTQQIATLTGNVQYNGAELALIDQFTGLREAKTQKIVVEAGAPLAYGQLLTLTLPSGRVIANVADATVTAGQAHAICDTPGGIATGATGEAVFMHGRVASIAGTTFGATYYLSTAGAVQVTAPGADGVLSQIVGIGLGTAGFYLCIEPIGQRVSRAYKTSGTNLRVQYTDGTFTDHAV